MKLNFALRTVILLAVCLFFENFNHLPQGFVRPTRSSLSEYLTNSAAFAPENGPFLANKTTLNAVCGHNGCKSIESLLHPVPSGAFQGLFNPSYRIKTIVLDAGHGGKDPGCMASSSTEKDNTLAIVLRLGAYIEANYPEIKVIYTRDSDVFVELNERAAIANRNNADLFVSVHCNAMPGKAVQGAETYVLGLHRTKDNLEVAKRENASIFLEKDYQKNYGGYDPNSPEAEIFANLWQSAYLEQSILLASYVQQFSAAVAFREDRGVKQAGFLVLRETVMPAVLIEAGYLTNATEAAFLTSDEGREQMAIAIFQSIEAYKRHMETGKQMDALAVSKAAQKPPSVTPSQPVKSVPVKTVAQKSSVPTQNNGPSKTETTRYTIFLLAWPNKLDPNVGQLSLLANVKETFKDGKYHYSSGTYASKAEAEKVLPEILNMGFKTANIISQ